MKNLIFGIAISSLLVAACNSGSKETATENNTSNDSSSAATEATSVNASSIDGILNPYFVLKNALTQDNDKAAAEAGKEMVKAFESFDEGSLNAEQSKVYTDIHEDAIEHAEHIGDNVGNIKHQREHFETLSEEIYELAKSVDGDRKLYYTNCPMYNNNKGANWVSEVKEIRNPYLGKEMLECGTIKEELN